MATWPNSQVPAAVSYHLLNRLRQREADKPCLAVAFCF